MTRRNLTELLALAVFVAGAILIVLAGIGAISGEPTLLQRFFEAL